VQLGVGSGHVLEQAFSGGFGVEFRLFNRNRDVPLKTVITIPKSHLSRLEKLAGESGRTPQQMLRIVLRDGFEYTEDAVQKIKRGLKQAERGEVVSHDQAMKTVRSAIEKHAVKRKKAA
jgi:predicted transcriptional regulator